MRSRSASVKAPVAPKTNVPALKQLVTREKAQELDDPNVAKMLATARQFMPESDISSIAVAGQSATIQLASKDKTSTGTVTLTKEGADWKVLSEKWKMQMEGGGTPAKPGSALPSTGSSPDKQ